MAVYSFTIEAMVRGYHVYQSIWDAAIDGENLECFREVGNIHDPSAVAIKKDGSVVGHIPRALSAVCSSFICRGGLILCRVSGSRRYSADLPQGGLEVPCVLTFRTSNAKDVEKAKKLIDHRLLLLWLVSETCQTSTSVRVAFKWLHIPLTSRQLAVIHHTTG